MNCPNSIESTPVTSPKSFTNWAGNINFTSSQSFRPTTRGEIVEIIRMAEEQNRKVKWTGSRWSFMQSFVSDDIVIESDNIKGKINQNLIIDNLIPILTEEGKALLRQGLLVHIKGGTKIFNVNRILHGLEMVANDVFHTIDDDEFRLIHNTRERTEDGVIFLDIVEKAMITLGGSGGQSIAGAISSGTHGGDIRTRPIADAVVAIHLIGPGGQEWWIEKSNGRLTVGTEEVTRSLLQTIANNGTGADAEICQHIMVKKDDNFFNSVLVSLGRMGFIYSLVINTTSAYKLTERRVDNTWETYFREKLSSNEIFSNYIRNDSIRYLNVIIMPDRKSVV